MSRTVAQIRTDFEHAPWEDKDLFAAAIDARAPYAMERIQTPWQNRDGVSRYRCPASAGKVGCPRLAGSVEVAREHGLPIVTPPETETAWCQTGTAKARDFGEPFPAFRGRPRGGREGTRTPDLSRVRRAL